MQRPDLSKIKIFADGCVLEDIPQLLDKAGVKGFTTNPTLMNKVGITDYEGFARKMLAAVKGLPVSLEVFADELPEMERQAKILAGWGDNVFVKVPVTNTQSVPTLPIISSLSKAGVKLNVTAVFTPAQIDGIVEALTPGVPAIVSVFSGRIADTGVDPCPIITHALKAVASKPGVEVLWASCRELYNVVQAAQVGCHIVTVPNDMLKKIGMIGKDLTELSLDTVKMFRNDAVSSGFKL
ncbi:MAG: transaldolase [Sandaracinaceae bacterium]|nr:transaldolase [Sandaracinaceae bacterium]